MRIWYDILADLLVNLAAGWFGAVFIAPNFFGIRSPLDWIVLTGDFVMGIVSLSIAMRLKRAAKMRRKNV